MVGVAGCRSRECWPSACAIHHVQAVGSGPRNTDRHSTCGVDAVRDTIPTENQPFFPGDEHIERRIRAFIRWNAAAMVVRANKNADGIGGHLSSYASSASLYEVGFNHFWQGKDDGLSGDHIYMQGHAAPGIYARAFLEGRLNEENLDNFRMEIGGKGLSSYPHPRLMPEFWEFPTCLLYTSDAADE